MPIDLKQISVRPVDASEEPRYRELMQQYHYLGDLAKIGHTLWYVATYEQEWIALLSFSVSALKCAVRDRWIGWDFRRQYLFKEYFQQFWDYESPAWAGKFLDQWCKEVMRSRIDPLKKFARTVRNHCELLLNYFRAKKELSSGIVEGLNNKAKVTMRKAYGFRTFKMTELALYHVLGKLPEPKLAHSFYGRTKQRKP